MLTNFIIILNTAIQQTHSLVVNDAMQADFLEELDVFLVIVVVAPTEHYQVVVQRRINLAGVPHEVLRVDVDALPGGEAGVMVVAVKVKNVMEEMKERKYRRKEWVAEVIEEPVQGRKEGKNYGKIKR